MKKNKIFIISGALLFGLFIALLFWLQTMEGQPNELQTSYQIEIFNCSEIGKDKATIDAELKAALLSTPLKKDGITSCYAPIVKIDNVEFGVPIYGMNYFRLGISSDMYLYEDRKMDEATFFEAPKDNEKYLELRKKASKGWFKKGDDVALDLKNNINEFIIYSSQKEKHTHNKKVWQSMTALRGHIDSLISIGANEKTIKVYYFCGDFMDGILDDDLDGIVNSKDSCRYEKGSAERNGCPPCSDMDEDGICDSKDECPDVKGEKNCSGCPCPPPPPCDDRDNDGVCDSIDACPDDFGKTRNGCPKDSDGDGIWDKYDECPNKKGPKENKGCPEINIKVSHNNEDGKFSLNNISQESLGRVYAIMKQKGVSEDKTMDFDGIIFPNEIQVKQLANPNSEILTDIKDMTVIIVVEDSNGTELMRQSFDKLSLLCLKNGECGFMDPRQ